MGIFTPRTAPRGLDSLDQNNWRMLHQGHPRFARQPEPLQLEALRQLRSRIMEPGAGPLSFEDARLNLIEAYRAAELRPPRNLRKR